MKGNKGLGLQIESANTCNITSSKSHHKVVSPELDARDSELSDIISKTYFKIIR